MDLDLNTRTTPVVYVRRLYWFLRAPVSSRFFTSSAHRILLRCKKQEELVETDKNPTGPGPGFEPTTKPTSQQADTLTARPKRSRPICRIISIATPDRTTSSSDPTDSPPDVYISETDVGQGKNPKVSRGDTETFQILAGVLQGDTLAPFLFILALDYALRCAIEGREEQLDFTLKRRASRRVPAKMVTDFDFADDLALISKTAERARALLAEVERHCRKIGLQLNAKKTKVMAFNSTDDTVAALNGTQLEVVKDFRYLGGWIATTSHDIKVRRALAWSALHNMRRVWDSNMDSKLKRRLFVSTVECVLLYGLETWTLTVQDERSLDGMCTGMLSRVLNVSREDHVTNSVLYSDLPRISEKIRKRRMELAGYSIRQYELLASQLILWEPTEGQRGVEGKDPLVPVLTSQMSTFKVQDTCLASVPSPLRLIASYVDKASTRLHKRGIERPIELHVRPHGGWDFVVELHTGDGPVVEIHVRPHLGVNTSTGGISPSSTRRNRWDFTFDFRKNLSNIKSRVTEQSTVLWSLPVENSPATATTAPQSQDFQTDH
ncbi:hypothetical protein Bbelb_070240 [Branchiostoma belcheri]|nr:hypothetical protein Bbelb_070240 [Branchiostoma belcheri]